MRRRQKVSSCVPGGRMTRKRSRAQAFTPSRRREGRGGSPDWRKRHGAARPGRAAQSGAAVPDGFVRGRARDDDHYRTVLPPVRVFCGRSKPAVTSQTACCCAVRSIGAAHIARGPNRSQYDALSEQWSQPCGGDALDQLGKQLAGCTRDHCGIDGRAQGRSICANWSKMARCSNVNCRRAAAGVATQLRTDGDLIAWYGAGTAGGGSTRPEWQSIRRRARQTTPAAADASADIAGISASTRRLCKDLLRTSSCSTSARH